MIVVFPSGGDQDRIGRNRRALTIAAILNSKSPFLQLPNNRFLSSSRSRFRKK